MNKVNSGTLNLSSHKFKQVLELNTRPKFPIQTETFYHNIEYFGREKKQHFDFNGYGYYFYNITLKTWIGPYISFKVASHARWDGVRESKFQKKIK